MASSDALALARNATAFRVAGIPLAKSDGTLFTTGLTGLSATVSKDQGTFGAATNSPVEIATNSGLVYLDLTSTEMTCNCIVVKIVCTNAGFAPQSGVLVIYPATDAMIRVNLQQWLSSVPNALFGGKLDAQEVVASGTASAGAAQSITLAGASATDNLYKYAMVKIISGTGAGQQRMILDYVGSTKVATVNKAWTTAPDNTSVFVIIPWVSQDIVQSGIAQAGAAATITLSSGAVATDDIYKGQIVFITGGTGVGQTRLIASYVGSTKVATVSESWVTNPDSTSIYQIMAQGRTLVDKIRDGAIAAATFASNALDAVWSTAARTLTAISDSAGVGTLLGRIASALTITGGKVDVNDKTGFALTVGEHTNVASDVQTGMTAQGATAARMGYLSNLNIGGNVASQADINALNQSASRRLTLSLVPQFERPESGTVAYTIELRTYDGDGAAVNADTTPTLAPIGSLSGSLAANLSSASSPATGVYRWTYTVSSGDTQEQIRFDVSATLSASVFTMSAFSQVVDLVAATWTSADASMLSALFNKLPSRAYLVGSDDPSGSVVVDVQAGLEAQGYTATRAAFMDVLNGIVAAVQSGLATTSQLNALQSHGDSSWATANISSLLTSSAFTTAMTNLQNHGDSTWTTANVAALLTTAGFNSAITALESYGSAHWSTADVSALLTAAAFASAVALLASQTSVDDVADQVTSVQQDTTAIIGSLGELGAGTTFVRSQIDDLGNLTIYRSKLQTFSWNNASLLNLAAGGTAVKLEFGDGEYSFPAIVTGNTGAWIVTVTLTVDQSTIGLGPYDGELALYVGSVEYPALAEFTVIVKANR